MLLHAALLQLQHLDKVVNLQGAIFEGASELQRCVAASKKYLEISLTLQKKMNKE